MMKLIIGGGLLAWFLAASSNNEPTGGGDTDSLGGTPTGGGDEGDDQGDGLGLSGGDQLPDVTGDSSAATVGKYYSQTPKPGSLYLVKAGNTAVGIAGVVGAGNKAAYVRRMTAVAFNRNMYGVPEDMAKWPNWPPLYSEGGQVLAAAFLPRHGDVRAELAAGGPPERGIGPTGGKAGGGSSYALLWLPPLAGDPNPPADLRKLMGGMG